MKKKKLSLFLEKNSSKAMKERAGVEYQPQVASEKEAFIAFATAYAACRSLTASLTVGSVTLT